MPYSTQSKNLVNSKNTEKSLQMDESQQKCLLDSSISSLNQFQVRSINGYYASNSDNDAIIDGDYNDHQNSGSDNENIVEETELKTNRLLVGSNDDENALNGLSDQYFLRKCKKKIEDKFFESLQSLEMDEKKFNDIVQNEFDQTCQELRINLKPDMSLHYQLLMNNFNIILYGFGSKIKILNHFIKSHLETKHYYIVIRGYSPEIMLKDVLIILNRPLGYGIDSMITNHDELLRNLAEKFQNEHHLFIVIHSIDRLIQDRKNLMKNFLIKLFTTLPNLHLIASADLVNFEFLWTQIDRDLLHLYMMPINTYEPYVQERKTINGGQSSWMTTHGSNRSQLSINFASVCYVYESLNDNAKKIFVIILKHFIEEYGDKKSKISGLKLDELYQICREEFLTSSLATVRQQLTEFKDHKLLKFKTGFDGSEYIVLCFDLEVARRFLDSIGEGE